MRTYRKGFLVCPFCNSEFEEIETACITYRYFRPIVGYGRLDLQTKEIEWIKAEEDSYQQPVLTEITFTCPSCGETTNNIKNLKELIVIIKDGRVVHKGEKVPDWAVKKILAKLV
jgi:hypothetical protein